MNETRYIARATKIAARMIGDEMMIMSGLDSSLFSLNPTASILWQAADGVTPLAQIVVLPMRAYTPRKSFGLGIVNTQQGRASIGNPPCEIRALGKAKQRFTSDDHSGCHRRIPPCLRPGDPRRRRMPGVPHGDVLR